MIKIFLFLLALFSTNARAEECNLRFFELDKQNETPLFTQKSRYEIDGAGNTRRTSSIRDAAGKELMTESALYNSDKLIHQEVSQLQTGESYVVDVHGQSVDFKTTKDKNHIEDETQKIDADDTFLTGPVFEPYIDKHWNELTKENKTLKVRFGVLELADTVGFKFSKEDTVKVNGKDTVIIRLRPTSPFISILVSPIDLYLDAKTHRLVRYRGRTPLKKSDGKKLEPFDGDIYYNCS